MGSMYFLIPRLFNKPIYSVKLIETHFWVATIGIVLYIAAMWISGVMQGLMWRAVNADGTLMYSFVESVQAMHPFYVIRTLGGLIFLVGMLIMAYNVFRTIAGSKPVEIAIPAPAH
jgi:cytochrome c oxidase cbb3-type subunit I